jgi:hypothetical protein
MMEKVDWFQVARKISAGDTADLSQTVRDMLIVEDADEWQRWQDDLERAALDRDYHC